MNHCDYSMFSWEICQKFAENTLFSYVFATCKPHFSPSVLHDAIFLATYVATAFPTQVEGRLQSITFCLRCRVWFYFLQRLQWIFRTSTSCSPFKGTVRINNRGGQETFQKQCSNDDPPLKVVHLYTTLPNYWTKNQWPFLWCLLMHWSHLRVSRWCW